MKPPDQVPVYVYHPMLEDRLSLKIEFLDALASLELVMTLADNFFVRYWIKGFQILQPYKLRAVQPYNHTT